MTQGKIERYHRSMKNILLLDNYYSPDDLKANIKSFVEYYNYQRYHESLNNVTPADVYTGRNVRIIKERQRIKERTMKLRKRNYKKTIARIQTMS
jgi:putative transposase